MKLLYFRHRSIRKEGVVTQTSTGSSLHLCPIQLDHGELWNDTFAKCGWRSRRASNAMSIIPWIMTHFLVSRRPQKFLCVGDSHDVFLFKITMPGEGGRSMHSTGLVVRLNPIHHQTIQVSPPHRSFIRA